MPGKESLYAGLNGPLAGVQTRGKIHSQDLAALPVLLHPLDRKALEQIPPPPKISVKHRDEHGLSEIPWPAEKIPVAAVDQLVHEAGLVNKKTALLAELLKILNAYRQPAQKIHASHYSKNVKHFKATTENADTYNGRKVTICFQLCTEPCGKNLGKVTECPAQQLP